MDTKTLLLAGGVAALVLYIYVQSKKPKAVGMTVTAGNGKLTTNGKNGISTASIQTAPWSANGPPPPTDPFLVNRENSQEAINLSGGATLDDGRYFFVR